MGTESRIRTSREALDGRSAGLGHLAWPVGITALTAAAVDAAFSVDRAGTPSFWILATAPTVLVGVFALFRAHRDGEIVGWLKPVWGDPTRGLLSALVLVGASLALVRLVAPAGRARESWLARLYLQFGDPSSLHSHAASVAMVIVIGAAFEEIVWRGLVTSQIAESVGPRTAWIWAAVLYALAQTPTLWRLRDPVAGANPLLCFAALALGLVWGLMARVFGRLVPGILSHAAFDWCVITMFRLWGPWV
jgi:membrane protease YdiL (CAAX protease family)